MTTFLDDAVCVCVCSVCEQDLPRRGAVRQNVAGTRPEGLHLLLWQRGGPEAPVRILGGRRRFRREPLI